MDLKILQIASNTENNKVIKDHTHKATHKNSICGDQMEISLKVKENKIVDFGSVSYTHLTLPTIYSV